MLRIGRRQAIERTLRDAAATFLLCLLLSLAGAAAVGAAQLPALAEVGPWPAVSNLIAYKGRIWFVNSVRYPDHNSADVYSFDPRSGEARFERALFSQDLGRPAIHRGLLYWPYEDARSDQGWGQVAATDGRSWRLFTIPSDEPIFHVHALASMGERVVASSSAWLAGLDISDDGGLTWRRPHERGSREAGVTRIVDLATGRDRAYGALLRWTASGATERSLLRLERDSVTEVAGWPRGDVTSMTIFRDQLYATVDGVLWRTTAAGSERVFAPWQGFRLTRLAGDADALFGVFESGARHAILRTRDGRDWTEVATFSDGTAEDMVIFDGVPFVGGRGTNGRGILWGSLTSGADPTASESSRWPEVRLAPEVDWTAAADALDAALRDPSSYENHGRALRTIVAPYLNAEPPSDFFSSRLSGPFAPGGVGIFGGGRTAAREDIGRWVLLWAMAVSRTGKVPVSLLAKPWTEKPNRQQKSFHATPIALFAARWLEQNDRATVDSLIARLLGQRGDPDWLSHELMTTLATLTGERRGWQPEAWQDWWEGARARWPHG